MCQTVGGTNTQPEYRRTFGHNAKISPTPPSGFDTDFFRWLYDVCMQLEVDIVEGPGLTPGDVQGIASLSQTSVPADVLTFYDHCTPWAMWTDPHTEWGQIHRRIVDCNELPDALLPININSQTGGCVVAVSNIDGTYDIIQTGDFKVLFTHGKSLRAFLVHAIDDELKYARAED